MKIGIIGSGAVGQQLGLGFIKLGHEVMLGTRSSQKLANWQKDAGKKASIGTFNDAAKFGEVLVLATSWPGTRNAIEMAGASNFSNKVVLDVTNPLDFSSQDAPLLASGWGNSGGEQVQRWLGNAKVVKSFNMVSAYMMCNPARQDGVPDMFMAGNDQEAKKQIGSFAKAWGWADAIDIGDIRESYWLEALTMLWFAYGSKYNTWSHAFKLLKK